MSKHPADLRTVDTTLVRRAGMAAAVLALLAVSCGGDDPAPTTTTEAPTETTQQPTKTTDDPNDEEPPDRSLYGVDLSGLELPPAERYEDYETLEDDTGQVEIAVPTDWDDIDTSQAVRGTTEIPGIWASTDLEALDSGYTAPGLQIDLRTGSTVENTLERLSVDNATTDVCAGPESFEYDDGLYVGGAELWTDCGEDGAALLHVAALRAGNQYVTLEIQMLTDADIDAALRAMEALRAVELDMGDNWYTGDGPTTQQVGDLFNIVISHPSGQGEGWSVAPTYDAAVIEYVREESVANDPTGREAGPGSTRFFTFEALAPGSTTITVQRCEDCGTAGEVVDRTVTAEVVVRP